MANPLQTSVSMRVALILILLQTQETAGWIPRAKALLTSSCFKNGSDAGRSRRRVLLSSNSNPNNDDDERKIEDIVDRMDGHEPLFAEGDLQIYISQLEAMMRSDSYTDNSVLEENERIVLGDDWIDFDEALCFGDTCGGDDDQCDIPEEYKVAYPKVDALAFLGIRRAEPLRVHRDFE
eukprot:CAMPEP_0172554158 /NCGR_PEP_ID=MMETSP1067-20121228/53440_1 /TAXON_ID=265564 ORGANISM="Thalassiosira punctigera, Strain Tpunct2005C2" /NCGR_SAMPLE_ID=MMETSP1067 /ASSEMBLY_ACC=CAM_ASM_000444 /LENGTH=178 /DNA_ID=CAMNT_0013342477 /DNA_START=81 /DNA_END=617 /DNA_ORIENTATION=-